MEMVYKEIINFIMISGKRIAKRAGKIEDIGIKKRYLTEEDIAIERGMKEIIKKHYPNHEFYAEEENETFSEAENVWIADPISSTKTFIQGLPHYGIVISYVKNKIVQFAVVYDPSADELFTAYRGKGAFLNGEKISVSKPSGNLKVVFNLSSQWKDKKSAEDMLEKLQKFELFRNTNSHAVNLCYVACGRYDGVICFCKDSFPYFAGSLIIQESGGIFTNKDGNSVIHHKDRVFIGGNIEAYKKLLEVLQCVRFSNL
ncbi:MAG: inositol monophosphatase [Candidatus Aenigmatarchaeota archaeon]